MTQISKAWIFVSHSTKDLDKVRAVRNAIENVNGEPVLFFLKCLSDHDEIDDLIKREIEARNFFLLCDSSNAKISKWVQDEVAHVHSLIGKRVEIIDLDSDWKNQLNGITAIMRHATLFLSYSRQDASVVKPVQKALVASDFAVWDPSDNLMIGDSFQEQMSSAIEDASKFGYFIHFLSRSALASKWGEWEVEEFFRREVESRYIPVSLEPFQEIKDLLPDSIRNRLIIDYSRRNLDVLLSQLFKVIGVRNTEQIT